MEGSDASGQNAGGARNSGRSEGTWFGLWETDHLF